MQIILPYLLLYHMACSLYHTLL
uniref:Uncharacterized protein n=1 Tax=Anguilla anguilla TaxID=7936 RepID=A0A0E9VYV6_ANGAN